MSRQVLRSGVELQQLRKLMEVTQEDIAAVAKVSERVQRKWERQQELPPRGAREKVVTLLKTRLAERLVEQGSDATERTRIKKRNESIEKENVGTRLDGLVALAAEDEKRADVNRTPPCIDLPASASSTQREDRATQLVARAITALRTADGAFRRPVKLSGNRNLLFLVEQHDVEPGLADLRAHHSLVFVPIGITGERLTFEPPRPSAPHPLVLPSVGPSCELALPLPPALVSDVLPGATLRTAGPVRAVLTTLCRERSAPAPPQLLSSAQKYAGERTSPRNLHNWFEVATATATALWSLHASNLVHGAIDANSILVRIDRGAFRDVTLIKYDGIESGQGSRPDVEGFFADRFALGCVLVDLLAGEHLALTPDKMLSPGFKPIAHLNKHIDGEMRRRAMNLCLRYLLEGDPRASGGSLGDVTLEPSTVLLQKLVGDIGALRVFSERKASRGGVAVPSPSRKSQKQGVLSSQLRLLCRMVSPEEAMEWCERYVGAWTEYEGKWELVQIEASRSALREGYGRSAAAALESILLDKKSAQLDPSDLESALRLFAGVLAMREGHGKRARDILVRFSTHDDACVSWWAKLLLLKTDYDDGKKVSVRTLEKYPGTHPDRVRRVEAWEMAHRYLFTFRMDERPSTTNISEIARLLHGDSAQEATFGALLLARAHMLNSRAADVWKSMRALLLSATYAATKELPHEYAAALAVGSALVRSAFTTPALAAELATQGVDADECLVLAADAALTAAEFYAWLDVPLRSCKAFEAASRCFFACSAPEWITEGFRWASAARNHLELPWTKQGMIAPAKMEPRFVAPRPGEAHRQQARRSDSLDEHSATRRAVERWRTQASAIVGGREHVDPGGMLQDNYYDLYGPGIEWAFGTGGVSIEHLRQSRGGELAEPDPGGVVNDIIRTATRLLGKTGKGPLRLLDLGCGTGADAWRLGTKDLEIEGIDSSDWSIQRALAQAPSHAGAKPHVRFRRLDIAALDPKTQRLDGDRSPTFAGSFDIVLLRDSLMHFADKRRIVKIACECLRPGGILVGTDWVQKRTATRFELQRLFETVWLPRIDTRAWYAEALNERLTEVHFEEWHSQAHNFFANRLAWVKREIDRPSAILPPDEVTVRLRAQTDLKTLCQLSGDDGPLGWIFFVAKKP